MKTSGVGSSESDDSTVVATSGILTETSGGGCSASGSGEFLRFKWGQPVGSERGGRGRRQGSRGGVQGVSSAQQHREGGINEQHQGRGREGRVTGRGRQRTRRGVKDKNYPNALKTFMINLILTQEMLKKA
ncbi:unnamed protein product [Didymodactylos carnosus]|uniref:Uncharacterized protein n=1 Tax=Didymodactylos carnosus TaxID=1234261 RepID=A0A8S2U777_9BILA|nr:unnamed protein product [Didymodactylos carnosus]